MEPGSHGRESRKAHFLNLSHGGVENASRTEGIFEVSGHTERMTKVHFWDLKRGSHKEAKGVVVHAEALEGKRHGLQQSGEVTALNLLFHLRRGIWEAAAPLYGNQRGDSITLAIATINTLILK